MPKRKTGYKPAPDAKRLEDYEPGVSREEAQAALRKFVPTPPKAAKPNETSESPDRASSET